MEIMLEYPDPKWLRRAFVCACLTPDLTDAPTPVHAIYRKDNNQKFPGIDEDKEEEHVSRSRNIYLLTFSIG
jgi:hypothetical protein